MANTVKSKTKSKNFTSLIALIGFALIATLLVFRTFAATAQVSLVANKASVVVGEEVTITASVNTGSEPVKVAQLHINYDASRLEYASIDYTGSPLTTSTPSSMAGNGQIVISRFSTESASGSLLVAKITFKALAAGQAAVTVDAQQSQVFSNNTTNNILTDINNAVVAVSQQSSPPPTTPDPSNPPTSPGQSGNPYNSPVAVPIKPTPTDPPTIDQGALIRPQANSTNSNGQPITNTEYYLDGNLIGTNDDAVIDTNNLEPGEYGLMSRSYADDGSVEESSQSIIIVGKTFVSRYGWQIVVAATVLVLAVFAVIARGIYMRTTPFYKTIN